MALSWAHKRLLTRWITSLICVHWRQWKGPFIHWNNFIIFLFSSSTFIAVDETIWWSFWTLVFFSRGVHITHCSQLSTFHPLGLVCSSCCVFQPSSKSSTKAQFFSVSFVWSSLLLVWNEKYKSETRRGKSETFLSLAAVDMDPNGCGCCFRCQTFVTLLWAGNSTIKLTVHLWCIW